MQNYNNLFTDLVYSAEGKYKGTRKVTHQSHIPFGLIFFIIIVVVMIIFRNRNGGGGGGSGLLDVLILSSLGRGFGDGGGGGFGGRCRGRETLGGRLIRLPPTGGVAALQHDLLARLWRFCRNSRETRENICFCGGPKTVADLSPRLWWVGKNPSTGAVSTIR